MTSPPEARRAVSAPGSAHHTIPAPARMAAWLTSSGAPVMPAEPPTTNAPDCHLCASGARVGSHAAHVGVVDQPDLVMAAGRSADGDADVGDDHLTRERTAGLEHEAGLARRERDRARRPDVRPPHRAGAAVDSRRDVDRDHLALELAELIGHPRGVAVERASEPGAVHRVDDGVGVGQRPCTPTAIDGLRELEDLRAHTPTLEHTRRDEPVAAVVALAAHQHDPAAVGPVQSAAHGPRDCASRRAP